MSSTVISDEKTNEIAAEKTKGTKEDNSSDIKRQFAHMLIDFNIVPYVIGFAIAMSFAELMKSVSSGFVKYYFKNILENDILVKFISFCLVLSVCYVFGYLIFYKFIYTEDIAKQTIIKKAINEKKEEEIKKEIETDVDTQNEIKSASQINKQSAFQIDAFHGISSLEGMYSMYST